MTTSRPPCSCIYLASQSPRRRDLLAQWGVDVELLLPDAHEDAEALEEARHNEAPARYVRRVTRLKLQAALQRRRQRGLPEAPVLCADTTVALGMHILGKPADAAHAQQLLERLAGHTHQVLTAVAVGYQGQVWQSLSRSSVAFEPWSPEAIAQYVATGEPMGKAGAYGIQGLAALHIRHIKGSYTGIMGLPAFETAQLLRAAGVSIL